MKDSNEVIHEFNDLVNMSSSELEKWLKSDDARSAGWLKEDESGESVGHDSGRKIVEILKSNPNKDPEKYDDDQISHMRKVVSYCKRHLAQEKSSHQNKSNEEVKQTKSYASLKNWGHDPLKGEENDDDDEEEEYEEEDDAQENTEQDDTEEKQAGDKRKKATSAQSGANKKRDTRQGKASSNGNKKKQEEDDDEDEEEEDDYEDDGEDEDADGDDDDQDGDDGGDDEESGGKKAKKGPKPGDKVSWPWGGGNPEGKVLDVKGEKTEITTKRGNKVTRNGDPEDPAVVLDTGKSKAVKANHELNQTRP